MAAGNVTTILVGLLCHGSWHATVVAIVTAIMLLPMPQHLATSPQLVIPRLPVADGDVVVMGDVMSLVADKC